MRTTGVGREGVGAERGLVYSSRFPPVRCCSCACPIGGSSGGLKRREGLAICATRQGQGARERRVGEARIALKPKPRPSLPLALTLSISLCPKQHSSFSSHDSNPHTNYHPIRSARDIPPRHRAPRIARSSQPRSRARDILTPPNPLLATALVDRHFQQLSQRV